MADLTKKISDLENEIGGYTLDLKNATSPEEKSELRGLIKTSRDTLNELLKRKIEFNKGSLSTLLFFCILLIFSVDL